MVPCSREKRARTLYDRASRASFAGPMAESSDYKKTLNLPQTTFAMKANLPQNEPKRLEQWRGMNLYQLIREKSAGPPEVRAARRTAVRQRQDSHRPRAQQDPQGHRREVEDDARLRLAVRPGLGLPRPADRARRRQGARLEARTRCRAAEIRRACRQFAAKYVDIQREDFIRLGVFGDWDNPYTTMSFDYEADIADALGRFFADRRGLQGPQAGALVHVRPVRAGRGRGRVSRAHLAVGLRALPHARRSGARSSISRSRSRSTPSSGRPRRGRCRPTSPSP